MTFLQLDAYRGAIALDHAFTPAAGPATPQSFDTLARTALRILAGEPFAAPLRLTSIESLDSTEVRQTLRAALSLRPAEPLSLELQAALDALLAGERQSRQVVDAHTISRIHPSSPLSVWQGDLTLLSADAIVNAANSDMLGCFQPLHSCIDNAIHTAAGPQLRQDCRTIMAAQGKPERTGTAKITRGYHLPSRFVLHTVGPIVRGTPERRHQEALAGCYTACLDLASNLSGIRTIAFCSISTGVFGYPKRAAAEVACNAIGNWIDRHPERFDRIICCTYTDDDTAIYQETLREKAW